MMRKIVIVFDDYSGGAGNIAQLLANEFSENNKVSILLLDKISSPRYELPSSIDIYEFCPKPKYLHVAFKIRDIIKQIRNVIRVAKPDIVISFLDINNILTSMAMGSNRIPMIACERSNPVAIMPKRVWLWLRRLEYKKIDAISVQFDAFKEFDDGRFISKCIVTPNIVSKPLFVKQDWTYDTTFKFVSLGRFDEIKRFPLMIKMFADLYKDNNNIELHIYGWGSEKEQINEYINELDINSAVYLHDKVMNVHETLSKYDCYLMTSYQEGFPNALSEAMAVGLPSISFTCHEGISELCQNGKSGFCINNNDEDLFVHTMKEVIGNEELRAEMGQNAQKIAVRYGKEEVMRIWEKCVFEAMKGKDIVWR